MTRPRRARLALALWLSVEYGTVSTACGVPFTSATQTDRGDAGSPDGAAVPRADASIDGAPCQPEILGTDPHHCGACGHDCRGAPCSKGICQPAVVATSPAPVTSLAVDSDELYATTWSADAGPGNGIFACPTAGCVGQPTAVAGGQSHPVNLRVDGNVLYWIDSDRNRVMSCARTGCTNPSTFFQGQGTANVADVTIDDRHTVYVVVGDDTVATTTVTACSPAGCPDAGTPFAVASSCDPLNIVYASGAIYFCNGKEQDECTNGALYTCPVSGCARPRALFAGLSSAFRIAADPSAIYLAGTASIQKLSFPSLSPTPLASLVAAPVDLAADGANVYWIEAAGFVRRVPAGGGEPLNLATEQANPHAMARDLDYLYWVASNPAGSGDIVLRVAK